MEKFFFHLSLNSYLVIMTGLKNWSANEKSPLHFVIDDTLNFWEICTEKQGTKRINCTFIANKLYRSNLRPWISKRLTQGYTNKEQKIKKASPTWFTQNNYFIINNILQWYLCPCGHRCRSYCKVHSGWFYNASIFFVWFGSQCTWIKTYLEPYMTND